MRRGSSQSNSVRWNRFTGAASISGSAAHPAPISVPRARCAGIWPRPLRIFPMMSWNCRPCWDRCNPTRWCGRCHPIWLLGSSTFSAQLAAMLGLPFAFASHFAPDDLMEALALYRSRFEPSKQLDRPYAMPGVNIIAADTDAEARRLFTSQQQAFINLRRGTPGRMPPPIDDIDAY